MDAGTKQLADILNGNRILEVPYYQRSYVWKEDKWSRFLSDMEYITSTCKNYFLGSVILKQQETGISQFDKQSIIDGQQRFTTFALFFKSLCLKTNDMETFNSKFTVRDKKANARHLAILHSINDRKDFEEVMSLNEDVSCSSKVKSNIIDCYNYFQKNINIDKLDIDVLLNHVIFIGISLQQGEDEQVIFDTINSLGEKLTTGELLKNYFFTESTREEYEELWMPIFEKNREFVNYWDKDVVTGRLKRANIDFFFTAYLNIKIQDPFIKVSTEHKIRYRRSEGLFNNYKDFINIYNLNKNDMIYDILDYAQLYHDNINPDIAKGDIPGKFGIERINFLIFVLDCTAIVPFVLYILKNVLEETERNAMFGYIESYVLRRIICKSENKSYSDLFSENLILRQIKTLESLKDYIENKEDGQALALPTNKHIINACRNNKYANKKVLAILYLLETRIREGKPYSTQLYPFDKYTLEHIMPKSWKDNWPMHNPYTEEERIDAICSIGNLAILPFKLNTSISNASWADKKNGKGKNSGLSKYATGIETLVDVIVKSEWNEDTIFERSNWIAEKINEIWPSYLPNEEEDELSETLAIGKIKLSLNDGAYVSLSKFVLEVVSEYIKKHPNSTFAQLKEIFHDNLCCRGYKFKGLLCSEEVYNEWENKNKSKRYMPDAPGRRLKARDGVVFYVNTQWTQDGIDGIIKIAKTEGFKVSILK
jgi:uncharacterized protein with ParB-like and HNH nuclease domain